MALVQPNHSDRKGVGEVFSDAIERSDATMISDHCHDSLPDIYGIRRDPYGDGDMALALIYRLTGYPLLLKLNTRLSNIRLSKSYK